MTLPRITLITSLLALVASTAFAGTIRVGPHRTYTTIQDGVDNASDGDTILIDKGVYVENVSVETANLTLRPAKKGKKGKVTISGGGMNTTLNIKTGADGCIARDLTIVDSVDYGIVVAGVTGAQVIRCTVSGGASVAGIVTGFSNNTLISKCKVLNVTSDGIQVALGDGAVVSKCTVKDVGGRGIEVNAADTAGIINNKIIRSSSDGIYLGLNTAVVACLVSGNTVVEASASDGIECTSFASQCVVEKNILRGNEWGLYTSGSTELLVTENQVDDSLEDGFYLNGTVTTYISNKITDSAGDNYYLSGASHCTLIKNKSRRAGVEGIDVEGDHHVLIKNDSRKSLGVDLSTSGATDCQYMDNIYDTSDF